MGDLFDKKGIEFFNSASVRYHPWTPVAIVLEESFYIKYNNLVYYVLRNEPLTKIMDSHPFYREYGCMNIQHLIERLLDNVPESETG